MNHLSRSRLYRSLNSRRSVNYPLVGHYLLRLLPLYVPLKVFFGRIVLEEMEHRWVLCASGKTVVYDTRLGLGDLGHYTVMRLEGVGMLRLCFDL